jgi:hypothetical protein
MKKIRLTESEFHSLIKRMVMEVQEEMNNTPEMEESFLGGMGDKLKDAAQQVASFFKNEVLSDMDEEDIAELKDKVEDVNIERELNKVERRDERMVAEGYITEGIGDKVRGFLESLGIYGGVGTSVMGLLGFIANVTGWSQTDMMARAHEIVQSVGLTGPVSVLVIVAGLVMALGSSVSKYNRTHR